MGLLSEAQISKCVTLCLFFSLHCLLPDHHNNPIKDIVRVLDVAKGPIDQNLQQHLQGEQAGEDNVTNLQGVGQLFRLEKQKQWQKLLTYQHVGKFNDIPNIARLKLKNVQVTTALTPVLPYVQKGMC